MPSSHQNILALALASTAPLVEAAMGPAFSTGPVGSGSWIREATSTLTLPKAPTSKNGVASLWVGMGTSNGDLVQSIADNWQSTTWDIYAYTLKKTGCMYIPSALEGTAMLIQDDSELSSAHPGRRI